MENEHLRTMDRDAETSAESQSESTLSNSLESGVTVESSRGDADSKKLDECDGWTNEKHNSYLDYLENSFVRQLYSLLGGGETPSLSTARHVQSNSHESTDQFTLLQNGYRHKVSFGKKRAHLETSSEFQVQKHSSRRKPENPNEKYATGTTVQGNVCCNEEIKISGDKASMRHSLGHEYHVAGNI